LAALAAALAVLVVFAVLVAGILDLQCGLK